MLVIVTAVQSQTPCFWLSVEPLLTFCTCAVQLELGSVSHTFTATLFLQDNNGKGGQ